MLRMRGRTRQDKTRGDERGETQDKRREEKIETSRENEER